MGDLQSLRVFINCLDQHSLPRILQVCSGVYFQGSIYELSGSEVCLSTGDLVKVIGLELLSVSCEEIDTGSSFVLPIEYSGQFRLVAEDLPYDTIEEIVGLCPVGVDACGSFTFISRTELTINNFTLSVGKQLTLLSVELAENGERLARCQVVGQNMASAEILLPLSLKGEFYESENERGYSLQEIMSSARLSCRRFRSTNVKNSGGVLVFSPVYEISAIMHMRKNVVKFPSSLEVDVQDVTEQSQDLVFITPLSMTEVASQPKESFPTMAEILDGPDGNQFFNCSWFQELHPGKHLVLHGCSYRKMILASTPKGRKEKQYFIISEEYGGRFRRRAREFGSVYEVYLASSRSLGLKISVTRHCEAVEEEGVPALSVGEQLEVLRLDGPKNESKAAQKVESLICKRTIEGDDEDDDEDEDDSSEEISLPLFMMGHFVEKLSDSKKYKLSDLVSSPLPVDVKVVTRDKELEKDPLMGLAALKLEETFTETTVLTSLPDKPDWCFELPLRWLEMSLCLTSDPLPWSRGESPDLHIETVTEVTEKFYYAFHKHIGKIEEPPPRPPKRKPSSSETPKNSKPKKSLQKITRTVTAQLDNLSLGLAKGKQAPALPPTDNPTQQTPDQPPPLLPRKISDSSSLSNTYVKSPRKTSKSAKRLSDHDYESIEEVINTPHESLFY